MGLQIIVNDIVLDLFEGSDEDFYITRQIHDIVSLQTRNASFAKNLDIPFTEPNKSAFFAGTPTLITTPQAVIQQPCQILIDGIPYIINGKASIPSQTISREAQVLNVLFEFENLEFFNNLIGNIDNQIDWSDLDFDWTEANLSARANNSTGLVFAFSSYFETQNIVDNAPIFPIWRGQEIGEVYGQEIDLLGFHIYLREIVTRVVERAGFTLDDTAMVDEQDYLTLALACPMSAFYELFGDVTPFQARTDTTVTQSETAGAVTDLIFRVEFDTVVVDGSPEIVWNGTLFEYEINDNFSSTSRFTIAGTFTQSTPNDTIEFRVVKNTTTIGTVVVTTDGTFTVQIASSTDVLTSDVVFVEATISKNASVVLDIGNNYSLVQGVSVIGRAIQVQDFIPSIAKKDFLQSFLAYFNALIDTDNITKTVFMTPFKDIITNEEQDFSEKLDSSREIETQHTIPTLFTISTLKYADNRDLRRTDADTVFIFKDDLIDERGTIIELLFGATDAQGFILVDTYDGTVEYPILPIDTENNSGDKIFRVSLAQLSDFNILANDGVTDADIQMKRGDFLVLNMPPDGIFLRRIVEVVTAHNGTVSEPFPVGFAGRTTESWQLIKISPIELTPPRIVNISGTLSYQIYNGANESPNFTVISGLKAVFSDSMLFASIVDNFYDSLLDALDTPYIVRSWSRFEAGEFSQIDLKRPVYIQRFNNIFYINKIEQWNPVTKLARVEYLRIGSI